MPSHLKGLSVEKLPMRLIREHIRMPREFVTATQQGGNDDQASSRSKSLHKPLATRRCFTEAAKQFRSPIGIRQRHHGRSNLIRLQHQRFNGDAWQHCPTNGMNGHRRGTRNDR